MEHVTLELDGDSIRFTPDGKVSVVDAIRALSAAEGAEKIWESLKKNNPEIADLCNDYVFKENERDCVVDHDAWELIANELLNYLIDSPVAA